MTKDQAKEAVEKIIEEIDKSTLLGAAYDCMSEAGKEKFKNRIQDLLVEQCH